MKAVVFDKVLHFRDDYPRPEPKAGETLIRVLHAGICQTDREIIRGYMGFRGVLGHEFVGVAEESGRAGLQGKRVVGEINASCANCRWCRAGMPTHCETRTVLGILGRNGCMAEYCSLPDENLHVVPDDVPSDRAILLEPLAAACRVLAQVPLDGTEKAVVLGDGRLGILCAWVLSTSVDLVTLVGKHHWKLELAQGQVPVRTRHVDTCTIDDADVVVETTGSADGLQAAMGMCRPRGTIVLKTTVAEPHRLQLAPVVINELRIVGSRCGDFADGMRMLSDHPELPLARLITSRYPISKALSAFEAVEKGREIKVVLDLA